MKRTWVSPENFVRMWQTSATVNEVVQKTGLKSVTVRARAVKYRKLGVPLKKMPRAAAHRSPDIAALVKLAEELATAAVAGS